MSGLWWCTHEFTGEDGSKKRKTMLHAGKQCTSGDEEEDCFLFQRGWAFISCRNALIEMKGEQLVVHDPDDVPRREK